MLLTTFRRNRKQEKSLLKEKKQHQKKGLAAHHNDYKLNQKDVTREHCFMMMKTMCLSTTI